MKATFGSRFKERRQLLGLKQEELVAGFNKKYHYNFTRAAISQYENDKRIPEIDALKAFADFFNVTVDYLLGNSDVPKPDYSNVENMFAGSGPLTLSPKDEKDVEKLLTRTIESLENEKGLMLNGEILDDDDLELLKAAIKNGLEYAKISNKKKYTPQKYRK